MPTIEVSLKPIQVQRLALLTETLGITRDQAVAAAIDDYYRGRSHLIQVTPPWTISLKAQKDLLGLAGLALTPSQLDWAKGILSAAAIDAVKAEQEQRRKPGRTGTGSLKYRGPSPMRLVLVVEGSTLVSVPGGKIVLPGGFVDGLCDRTPAAT